MKRIFVVLLLVVIALSSANLPVRGQGETPIYKDASQPVEERVADLLSKMTLEEKIGQMTLVEKNSIKDPADITNMAIGALLSGGGGYPQGNNTAEGWAKMVDDFQKAAMASRLEVPMIYGVDAVHGHNNMVGATIFPHNIGLGAANDPELVEKIGKATAAEMIATGIYWNYSPVVAVVQDVRWGRTYESFGQHTAQVSELSTALIRGLQGEKLNNPDSVLATIKHYVGDGGTKWGSSTTENYQLDQGVTDIDEKTLREVHLPPYIHAIENGARSIMVSFSSWGGMKMHAQKYLITDVLKGELGFTGFVVSDWQGIEQIPGSYDEQMTTAINAGVDMNMVPYDYKKFMTTMKKLVDEGKIPTTRIDDAVKRILTVKFEMGLFERPYSDPANLETVGSEEHRALAREAVSKSLVLLQNNEGALPLAKDTASIFVAGTGADDIGMQSGGWTIEWQGQMGDITEGTTILKAIEDTVSDNTQVTYSASGLFEGNADVGIVVVGERPYAEGRGDKADLTLSKGDLGLIDKLRPQVKKLVVILLSGRPMIIGGALNKSDAFVAAWLPGTEGQGVADVLFGDKPFTGKLSFTWPRTMKQIPVNLSKTPGTGCAAPLFPTGYGLDTSNKDVVKDECFKEEVPATPAVVAALPEPAKELLAPPEIEGEVVYIPFPVKIELDGKLEDWAAVPMTTVDRGISLSSDPAENGSYTFALAADDTNLYIMMAMPDQNIITGMHDTAYWNEDSLEFYINFTDDLAAKQYKEGIFQVNVNPGNIGKTDPNGLTFTGVNAENVKVKGVVVKTPDGWAFEAAVPLPKAPEHGTAIGFQTHANGASELDRNVKLIWSLADSGDLSYQDPSLFGQGIFFEVGSKDIPAKK